MRDPYDSDRPRSERYRRSEPRPPARDSASSGRARSDSGQGRRQPPRDPDARRRAAQGAAARSASGGGAPRHAASTAPRRSRTGSHAAPRPASGRRPAGTRKSVSSRKRFWLGMLRLVLIVGLLVGVALGITGCFVYNAVSETLPDPSKPIKGLDQTTKVLDRTGAPIVDLFAEQNRTDVALKDIPAHVQDAVMATEDERYYEHKGLDFIGMLRAVYTDIKAGDTVAGGSTITQQYVKQAFLTPERTWRRKVAEAVLAYRLEQAYDKPQILVMYLNTVYFGHGAYGVQSAARVYFGKDVHQLSVAEAAVIAGVIKSPRRYSPYYDMEAAKKRRDVVLGQMREQDRIDEAAYRTALAEPLKPVGLKKGSKVAPYFVEYVREQLLAEYGEDQVYRGGLRVTTTLDLKAQAAAEQAIAKTLNKPADPSAALVAVDVKTGEILAMVGGRDFQTQQYNVAVQGHRQSGSSFKPFVLVTALDQGISPEATFESGPMTIEVTGSVPWKVTGAKGGPTRLRAATAASVNSVFAQLIMQVGPENVVDMAHEMGIETKITPVPAVALGGMAEGVTPLEMASAFGTLANAGVHAKPFGVLKVTAKDGTVLSEAKPRTVRAIDPAVAYLATDILKGVITGGTGKKADIGRPAAGKTGTTQENSDAWFVGYTPQIAAAVWMGYPEEMRPMTNVHGVNVTGGSFPAQIWAAFMKAAVKSLPKADFVKPDGLATRTICLDTGGEATQYCPRKGSGLFLEDHLPEPCALHQTPSVIVVPNLVNMMKQDAIALLEKSLLKYAVQEKESPGVTPGMVTAQDPAPGSNGSTATVVTIVVSSGTAQDKSPVPAFDWQPKQPAPGNVVKFDASGTTDDGQITKWLWEFGDGDKDTTSGKVVSHKYPGPGTYDVVLWVTDDVGHTVSITHQVQVK